ncbi:MAG: WYL domain-containing protein [Dokdonella sp.]|nr:WYL domain-containing protein [Dokdonella sp.]
MATHPDTLSRQWLMLRCIPRFPMTVTARELAQRLRDEGFDVTKRTVERDLATLSEAFPLASDERTKPFAWNWQKDALQFSLPGMSPLQAMVLALGRTHLKPLLPAHLLEPLRPYFMQADAVLRQTLGKRGVTTWTRRVAIVQPTQPLLPPQINAAALAIVHEAVARQRSIDMRYRSRAAGKAVNYRVNPLGIVYRGVIGYLVGTIGDHDDPRQFALHRIDTAAMLDGAARAPEKFDLNAYAQSGAFGFMDNGPIKLVLRMEAAAAQHLRETPLSTDQRITDDKLDGWVRVTATVHDTSQLRWWLLAFGAYVEVLGPRQVKKGISETVRTAALFYANTPSQE